ncbi:hemolysin family protein [Hydrogenobacter thermophilus]|uniref:hemolysin family protein n=1 Tax=Hydrogenobacter thermophilus TaxID=940 RepID=UPI0030F77CD8
MEDSSNAIYTEILLIVFLLLLSGFFSSSEIVFFGANRYLLKRYSKSKAYSLLRKLLSKPRELLFSVLIGNEVVNVLISSYGTKIFVDTFGKKGAILSVLVMSLLIFVIGEVMPKNLVLPFTTRLSLLYSPIFYVFHTLFAPVRLLFARWVERLLGSSEPSAEEKKKVDQVFWEIFEMGHYANLFSTEEREAVERAMSLDEVLVKEIMTPRPDIFALDEDLTVEKAYSKIIEKKHSRIPIFKGDLDNITGIVYVKDIVPIYENTNKKLKDFKKEVLFVPEILNVINLLKEMRVSGVQIALVVGEHGEVAGLVTIHDILKRLLGSVPEVWEEDTVRISKSTYRVYGWADIEKVAKIIGFNLPEEYEYDTVGGFVMANLSKVPEEGDEFEYDGFKFIVDKMDGNRIVSLYIMALEGERV